MERSPQPAPRLAVWFPWLAGLLVACCYANALDVGFHFDDAHVIEDNLAIRSLASVPRFFVDPAASTALPENRVVRPLLLTTFALNYAVSALDSWSYHLVNIALHWLVVVLIFRVVRDHLWLGSDGAAVGIVAASIVAVHPLNTSAVDYVSARSAILAAVLYLAAFDAGVRGRRARCAILLALALLVKEISVSLPAALLGYWLVARVRPDWKLLGGLVGLAAAALGYRAILLPPSVLAAMHAPDVSAWRYCMTGWSAYLYYLRLFFWPDCLVVDRLDYPIVRSFADPQAWGSLLVLVALALAAWRARRRWPAATLAALWIFVTLAPETILFPLAEPVNEHRPYLAMLGFGTLAALGLRAVAGAIAAPLQVPAAATWAVLAAASTALLGSAAVARNTLWSSDYELWMDATRKAPTSTRSWTNAGHAALALGRHDEARRLLAEGHRLAPCYLYALLNLSALERAAGDDAAALRWADEAVRCLPASALAHQYRAVALRRAGRPDEALAAARRATDLDPRHAHAWMEQAQLLEVREEWAAAAAAYDRVLELDPRRAEAAMGAGVIAHYRLGDAERAIARYHAALAAVPTHYGARYQLAVALLASGRSTEARDAWAEFRPLAEAIGDTATLAAAPAALRVAAGPAEGVP